MLSVNPSKLILPENFVSETALEVQIENTTDGFLAFKFLVRYPQLCRVSIPKGVLPPKSQQRVLISMYPPTADSRISKVVVNVLSVPEATMPDAEFKSMWTTRKEEIESHHLRAVYGDSHKEKEKEPSGEKKDPLKTPAAANAVSVDKNVDPIGQPVDQRIDEAPQPQPEEKPEVVSCVENNEPQEENDKEPQEEKDKEPQEEKEKEPQEEKEKEPQEEKEPEEVTKPKDMSEEYKALKEEYEKLKSEYLTLQGRNANLAVKAGDSQKKVDDRDRADRRSWIMFYSALMILLAVIIYSFSRPSCVPNKEL